MRRSYTAVVERGEPLAGEWATEPYEVGWATEALFFLRLLDAPPGAGLTARVQLSPDGMRWVDEGTALPDPVAPDGLAFARVREFGNWLRLAGTVSGPVGQPGQPGQPAIRAIIYLTLKE
jgi:hypothetical protein